MKRIALFFAMLFMTSWTFGQTVTLTFTGRDVNNNHCQLNRVVIANLSKNWQEIIYWPDTTLTVHAVTGIEDYAGGNAFILSQNNPNPFTGITEASLTVLEQGDVAMEILDVNGRLVAQATNALQVGQHKYRVQIADAGIYFMTARQNGKSFTVKMVNNGHGLMNLVEHVGVENPNRTLAQVKGGIKGSTNNPFSYGDQME